MEHFQQYLGEFVGTAFFMILGLGTIANIYKEELQEAANALGVKLGVIAKSPMEGLIKYYTQKE